MNKLDREIALALLKRLRERGLISDDTYFSASASSFFDISRFDDYDEASQATKEESSTKPSPTF